MACSTGPTQGNFTPSNTVRRESALERNTNSLFHSLFKETRRKPTLDPQNHPDVFSRGNSRFPSHFFQVTKGNPQEGRSKMENQAKISCPACGSQIGQASHCPQCQAAAAGQRYDETVSVNRNAQVVIPNICCCCLGSPDTVEDHEITRTSLDTRHEYSTSVRLPWCSSCLERRCSQQNFGMIFAVAGAVLVGVGLYFFLDPLESSWRFAASFFGGLFGGAILAGVANSFRGGSLPGHVKHCDAFDADIGIGGHTIQLTLHNKAFAKVWREANKA